MTRAVRVLSIDGGGIRGIIPAIVLARIEAISGSRIHELFDLIAGTSIGGIIALAITVPDNNGNAKYAAEEVVSLFLEHPKRIFRQSMLSSALGGLRSLFGAKYSPQGLASLLEEYLGQSMLSDSLVNLVIPGYEIEQRTPWLFRTRKARIDATREDFYMKDVGLATSAAPTYFPPHAAQPGSTALSCAFIDGGVYANNPALCAYVEARKQLVRAQSIELVSLGTGVHSPPIINSPSARWGLRGWARPLFGITMDGVSQITHHHLENIMPVGTYNRFNSELRLSGTQGSLDDISPRTIRMLQAHARYVIHTNNRELNDLCTQLLNVG